MRTQSIRALVIVGSSLTLAAGSACAGDAPTRQEVVAERGAEVMPFDLERTTHDFEPTSDGGVQRVVADDADDQEQISLIQDHLRKEARAFAQGDFGDPAEIHGHEMPGLQALQNGYRKIEVEYTPIDTGGRIHYRTSSPRLVQALHDWFEAQVMDHGSHAEQD